jgi:hypothetical protein
VAGPVAFSRRLKAVNPDLAPLRISGRGRGTRDGTGVGSLSGSYLQLSTFSSDSLAGTDCRVDLAMAEVSIPPVSSVA